MTSKHRARLQLSAGMGWTRFAALTCMLTVGCAPMTRRYVGFGVAGAGAISTLVAISLLAPCAGSGAETAHSQRCADHPNGTSSDSKKGGELLAISLTGIVIGGVLVASSFVSSAAAPPAPAVAQTSTQENGSASTPDDTARFPLELSTACELAQQYLSSQQFSANGAAVSFRVLSCSGPVRVERHHAQLDEVHLRASSSDAVVNATICFEHGSDWFVKSAGTVPCPKTAD